MFSAIGDGDLPAPQQKPLQDAEALYREAADTAALLSRASFDATFELKRPSLQKVRSVIVSDEEFDEDTAQARRSSSPKGNPALTGTIVHRLMEVLVSSGNKVSLDKAVTEITQEYGADAQIYQDILLKVGEAVRSGGYAQKNGAPRDILTELLNAEEVHCELPFCRQAGNGLWNGVMDVVYRKDGRWHIVDYKTNADPDDLDALYQEQLEAYREAFRAMTGEDADALIYHIEV